MRDGKPIGARRRRSEQFKCERWESGEEEIEENVGGGHLTIGPARREGPGGSNRFIPRGDGILFLTE